jgi:hypothetical protein
MRHIKLFLAIDLPNGLIWDHYSRISGKNFKTLRPLSTTIGTENILRSKCSIFRN